MTRQEDRRKPSWKYIATTAIGLILCVITPILYAGITGDVKGLQNSKLDKTEYYKDYQLLNKRMEKIDDIYDYLLEHRHATEKKKLVTP
jgi:hypothetical protein